MEEGRNLPPMEGHLLIRPGLLSLFKTRKAGDPRNTTEVHFSLSSELKWRKVSWLLGFLKGQTQWLFTYHSPYQPLAQVKGVCKTQAFEASGA